jgi:transposase-like protein
LTHHRPWLPPRSAFTGFRFPPEVIAVAVRWYLRFGLSYRDVEELLLERGVEVDHVTVYRWVQRFTPLLLDAARFGRHCPGDRWFVDETYVKVNGVWRYVYRAIDQYGQVIDVLLSARRDAAAARRFFHRALATLKVEPVEVITDAAPVYPAVLDEVVPSAWHHVEQYANNPIEADHSRLKHRLRPMRGLRTDSTAQVIISGYAFVQNLRRGHYELGVGLSPTMRVAAAFSELVHAIRPEPARNQPRLSNRQRNGAAAALGAVPLSNARDLMFGEGATSH